jgi:hypothetical protein
MTAKCSKKVLIEYYILQVLFFILYLPIVTIILNIILSSVGIKSIFINGLFYFPIFALLCIINTRIFPYLSRKNKYIIIAIPLIIGILLGILIIK